MRHTLLVRKNHFILVFTFLQTFQTLSQHPTDLTLQPDEVNGAGESIIFRQPLANGIYFAEIVQDANRKVLRVVKQRQSQFLFSK